MLLLQAKDKKAETADLKEKSQKLNQVLSSTENELKEKLVQIPNIPHESVPVGNSEEDNKIMSQEGDLPDLGEPKIDITVPLSHTLSTNQSGSVRLSII